MKNFILDFAKAQTARIQELRGFELPKFKVEEAIIDRIVVIPFNNKFEVNITYEYDMLKNIDILFSYILK
jgi:hypothetical protein